MEEIDEILRFCAEHAGADPATLRLKYLPQKERLGFDVDLAITQLECRRKTAAKLRDFLAANPRWIFPGTLQAEQASGDITARFHASLVAEGDKVLDITCGLGIDDRYIADRCSSLITCEIALRSAALAEENFRRSGADNIRVVCGDSMQYLAETGEHFDTIFADPARRDSAGRRVFAFEDCSPDIVAGISLLRSRCRRLIVKGSPMMDISAVERQLPYLSHIYVVSVRNECREIVCICEFPQATADVAELKAAEPAGEGPILHALNFLDINTVQTLSGPLHAPRQPEPLLDSPQRICEGLFLAIPNASILKSGRTDLLQRSFTAPRLDANTNIYLFEDEPKDFPGRVFSIENVYTLHDRRLKALKGEKCNILTRNFPLTPEQLKKRLRTADGTRSEYIIGATAAGKPLIIKARLL